VSSYSKDADPFSESDAAYVMGALTADERLAFEAHLAGCPHCSQSVAELSGVTDLLDRVPLARVLEPGARPEPPPDLLLPMLIGAVRAQRRRHALWLAASGAVAASLVALAIVIGVNQRGSSEPPGVSVAMSTVRPTAAVAATLQLSPASWGTRVSADCRWVGATTGEDAEVKKVYRLVAVPRDGSAPQVLAQWSVLPGDDAKVVGSTDLPTSRIAAIELRAVADGAVLLRARPSA
jgi:anti-sigma factor RsiW